MEPVFVGWLSLLPPIIAIGLALITKEVISSLMIGILSGALIYALNTGLNPVVGVAETTFKLMAGRMDVNILLFLALLGALVCVYLWPLVGRDIAMLVGFVLVFAMRLCSAHFRWSLPHARRLAEEEEKIS